MSDSRFPFYRSKASERVRRVIGQQLREMYGLPRETPHRLLTVLLQLDADGENEMSGDAPPRDG
jgi:hypothetical protein